MSSYISSFTFPFFSVSSSSAPFSFLSGFSDASEVSGGVVKRPHAIWRNCRDYPCEGHLRDTISLTTPPLPPPHPSPGAKGRPELASALALAPLPGTLRFKGCTVPCSPPTSPDGEQTNMASWASQRAQRRTNATRRSVKQTNFSPRRAPPFPLALRLIPLSSLIN